MDAEEQDESRKESAMPTQDEKLNIYPPSLFDPLLPGGIPSKPDGSETPAPDPEGVAKDACLGGLARDVEAEAPCGACGRYTVNLGGVCPGCGAVR